jgi:voltage-gated potassium channel
VAPAPADPQRGARVVKLLRTPRRVVDRFLNDPASIRNAALLIIGATVVAVLAGGLIVWLFDRTEYPTFGRALWFTLQTVTTVGYGDVTPSSLLGRVVGAVVMLTAIGFITIVTAAITSTFVEAARRKADRAAEAADTREFARLEETLAGLAGRLDRIEATLDVLARQHPSRGRA